MPGIEFQCPGGRQRDGFRIFPSVSVLDSYCEIPRTHGCRGTAEPDGKAAGVIGSEVIGDESQSLEGGPGKGTFFNGILHARSRHGCREIESHGLDVRRRQIGKDQLSESIHGSEMHVDRGRNPALGNVHARSEQQSGLVAGSGGRSLGSGDHTIHGR